MPKRKKKKRERFSHKRALSTERSKNRSTFEPLLFTSPPRSLSLSLWVSQVSSHTARRLSTTMASSSGLASSCSSSLASSDMSVVVTACACVEPHPTDVLRIRCTRMGARGSTAPPYLAERAGALTDPLQDAVPRAAAGPGRRSNRAWGRCGRDRRGGRCSSHHRGGNHRHWLGGPRRRQRLYGCWGGQDHGRRRAGLVRLGGRLGRIGRIVQVAYEALGLQPLEAQVLCMPPTPRSRV
jgi:hypothetical protein